MGHDQHIHTRRASTTRGRSLRRRVCLRKGCGCVFQPRRWNQRYCQDPECLRLLRRWQAAKRQRQRRQIAEHRERHCEAERQRRKQCRERAADTTICKPTVCEPAKPGKKDGAWSRSKGPSESFCDRPGCYDPVRSSSRAKARYCSDQCAQAMRRVLDRERKWFRRKTYVGRFKRHLEYQRARRARASEQDSVAGTQQASAAGAEPFGPQLFEFL
jgi:hypothetical protein